MTRLCSASVMRMAGDQPPPADSCASWFVEGIAPELMVRRFWEFDDASKRFVCTATVAAPRTPVHKNHESLLQQQVQARIRERRQTEAGVMADNGTSVTLIFYKVGSDWYKEPLLNLAAAAAQMSSYTHVELAIGEVAGQNGMMANVARIYNDNVGVEICERTGRNPQYTYLALGCSRAAESRMLAFARQQVGKPFSNIGMARSLLWPRSTDNKSFYCAELVAAILKQGGLLSQESNPGAATPHSIFKLYSKQAAATANPFVLRQAVSKISLNSVVSSRPNSAGSGPSNSVTAPLLGSGVAASLMATLPKSHSLGGSARRHSDSPPRASFKLLAAPRTVVPQKGLTISLNSLR